MFMRLNWKLAGSVVHFQCCTTRFCADIDCWKHTVHNAVGQTKGKQWADCGLRLQYKERKKLRLNRSSTAWSGVLNLGYRPHQYDHVSSTACREGMSAWSCWLCAFYHQTENFPVRQSGKCVRKQRTANSEAAVESSYCHRWQFVVFRCDSIGSTEGMRPFTLIRQQPAKSMWTPEVYTQLIDEPHIPNHGSLSLASEHSCLKCYRIKICLSWN